MSDVWIIALVAAIVAVLAFLIWKIPQLRKYWKYFLIVAPALIILLLVIFVKRKRKDGKEEQKAEALRDSITEIKEKLTEVQLETAVEVSAAKAKNEVKIEELKEVKKLPSRSERLKRLASMMN
jgi:membrane protein implicated in regulation of membrane protease activity